MLNTTNQMVREFARILDMPAAVHKGIFYFATCEAAHCYAASHRLPTDRIIRYGRGWAIQLRISGPYAGPAI